MLKTRSFYIILPLILLTLVVTNMVAFRQDTQAQGTTYFLSSPYFAGATVTSIFDHEFPVYCSSFPGSCYELNDRFQITIPGTTTYTVAHTMIHYDGVRLDDLSQASGLGYTGHDGIDYGYGYDYVLATHSGDVIEAGWDDPSDHTEAFGLHVRLLTTDEVHTGIFGHLNTLMVETGDDVVSGSVLGISGETGNAHGAHLHLSIERAGETPGSRVQYDINPYGWQGGYQDPWDQQDGGNAPPSERLWIDFPAVSNPTVYPSGTSLTWPDASPDMRLRPELLTPGTLIIDNEDPQFNLLTGLWSLVGCTDPDCYDDSFYYIDTASGYHWASWHPDPGTLLPDQYDVYVYIPDYPNNTYTYNAVYEVKTSLNRLYELVHLSQSRFKNRDNLRWAYLGRFTFTGDGEEYIRLHGEDNRVPGHLVFADALAFVPADIPNPVLTVASGANDASRRGDFNTCHQVVDPGLNEIYFGHCPNRQPMVSGFRFENIPLPVNAVILAAYLELTIDSPFSNALSLRLLGEYSTLPLPFTSAPPDSNLRQLTLNYVDWAIPTSDEWNNPSGTPPGVRYSPDLRNIVQEIAAMNTWDPGVSDMVFLVRPQPFANLPIGIPQPFYRRVMAYERDPDGLYAARLLIWYEECQSPPNCLVEP